MILILVSGCSDMNRPSKPVGDDDSSNITNLISESFSSSNAKTDTQQNENPNMVDERFELLSLIFRLAGREEYNDKDTEYQLELVSEFDVYKEHAAIKYASSLPLGYDAVFRFSVHILKEGEEFVLIKDIDSLIDDGRWTRQSAADFLTLLNIFYTDTEFAKFYQSHIGFYETETQNFIDGIYSTIDFEWFRTYADPANMHCVYSLSNSRHNYSATVNNTLIYYAVTSDGSAIVHELCHSFANPIAHKWYEKNAEFKKWCDDTINPVKLPSYTNGKIIAGEYVTRAYNTLYYTDHDYALVQLILAEKGNGFPYIEDIYAMITPYEKMKLGDDKIEYILGVKYETGAEQSFSMENRVFRWRVLTLAEPLKYIYQQTEVGNVFGSKTGDVLYVEDTNESNPFLLIDLGEITFQGNNGYRKYCRLSIE